MTDQNRERKFSYMEAVTDEKEEKQAELLSFKRSLNGSCVEKDNSNSEPKALDTPTETFVVNADIEQECKDNPADQSSKPSWGEFSEYTTLHGFRFVFVRRPTWVRVIWLVLLLTCTSYVVYSLCSSLIKYFQFPIATVIKIEYPEHGMSFPAVTLCPMTTLTRTKASMTDDNPLFHMLGLNIDACKVTAAVRAGRPCGEALLCCCSNSDYINAARAIDNCTDDYKTKLIDVLRANRGSFNERDFFKAYGPSRDAMIVRGTCYFGSEDTECSYKDFHPIVTEFGVCYSFNSETGEKALSVRHGDVSAGLFVMLNLRVHDHVFGLFSEGVRVLVHNQGEYINPWDGLLIGPGSHAQVSVTKKIFRNKKKPYETQCDDSKQLASFKTYTSDGCVYECLSNETFKTCQCRSIGDIGKPTDHVCYREDSNCTGKVLNELFEGAKSCDCPLACDVVNYESTVSTASFPNLSMMKILKHSGFNRTEEYFRKNLIYLQVGYKAFRFEHFRQTSQYDSGALMGEIGGNLGLFLGTSILTICEFVDFIIYLCYVRNKKTS